MKKYVPIHKQGDVCPNGVPALVERDDNGDDLNSRIISGPLFIAPSRASFDFWLCAQKCEHLTPPPNPIFLKRPFRTDFKKYTYTPPPKKNNILGIGEKVQKNR